MKLRKQFVRQNHRREMAKMLPTCYLLPGCNCKKTRETKIQGFAAKTIIHKFETLRATRALTKEICRKKIISLPQNQIMRDYLLKILRR